MCLYYRDTRFRGQVKNVPGRARLQRSHHSMYPPDIVPIDSIDLAILRDSHGISLATFERPSRALRVVRIACDMRTAPSFGIREALPAFNMTGGQVARVISHDALLTSPAPSNTSQRVALVTSTSSEQELPLLPPGLPVGRWIQISERTEPDGHIEMPLTPVEVARVLAEVAASRAQSVAVCLPNSAVNPEHEQMLALALEDMTPFVSSSWQITAGDTSARGITRCVGNAALLAMANVAWAELRDELEATGIFAPHLIAQHSGAAVSSGVASQRPIDCIDADHAVAAQVASRLLDSCGVRDALIWQHTHSGASLTIVQGGRCTALPRVRKQSTLQNELIQQADAWPTHGGPVPLAVGGLASANEIVRLYDALHPSSIIILPYGAEIQTVSLLLADLRYEIRQPIGKTVGQLEPRELHLRAQSLRNAILRPLMAEGLPTESVRWAEALELRAANNLTGFVPLPATPDSISTHFAVHHPDQHGGADGLLAVALTCLGTVPCDVVVPDAPPSRSRAVPIERDRGGKPVFLQASLSAQGVTGPSVVRDTYRDVEVPEGFTARPLSRGMLELVRNRWG